MEYYAVAVASVILYIQYVNLNANLEKKVNKLSYYKLLKLINNYVLNRNRKLGII
jgi:hypothetical protein